MNTIALYTGWIVIIFLVVSFVWAIPDIYRNARDSWIYTWRLFDAVKLEDTWRLRWWAVKYWFLLAIGWEAAPDYAVCYETGLTAYWPGQEYRRDDYDDPEIEIPDEDPTARDRHPFD